MIVPMNIIAQVEHHFYDSQLVLQIRDFLELVHLQPLFGYMRRQILINQSLFLCPGKLIETSNPCLAINLSCWIC